MPLASTTIGAAATSRCVRKYTAAATQNSIMQTKNTRRPSRSRSRRAPIDTGATPDDLREAVTTLEDAGRIARRVFGGAHPTTRRIEAALRESRASLRTREWGPLVLAVAIAVVGWVSGARFFAVALVVFTWLWRR